MMTGVVAGVLRRLCRRFCFAIGFAAFTAIGCTAWPQERLIVALGDSNTQGVGVAPQQAYPARLEAILRRSGHDVRVANAGVLGDTFAGMLRRVNSSVPIGTSLVIVQGGYNDLQSGLPPAQIIANLRAVLAAIGARGARAVVCGFFRPDWDAMGRGAAAMYQAAFIPGQDCYDPRYVGPDQLHMSPVGHVIVAQRLARVLAPMLVPRRPQHLR
jgi:acyl-CoA thioesterase-1